MRVPSGGPAPFVRVAPPGSKLPHLLLLLLTGTLDLPFRLPVSSLPRLHSCPSFQNPFLSSFPTQPVASDLSVSLSSITISISPLTLPLHPPRIRPRTLFRDIIRGSRCSCILIFLSTQSRKTASVCHHRQRQFKARASASSRAVLSRRSLPSSRPLHAFASNPVNTAKLSSPILLQRTVSYDAGTKPPRRGSIYLNMPDRNTAAGARRRRSSSILQVYHEPPETLEQISDQASLPNLNANWTNAKGIPGLHILHFASLRAAR